MNLNTLKKRTIGAATMIVMALGIMVMAGASAQAQYRDNDRWDDHHRNRWSASRTREYAYAYGYFVAYPEGREHHRRGDRLDHEDIQLYRNDTNGFLGWMGDRNDYRSNYRRGFQTGFRDGRDGRNPRITRREVERILGASLREVYGRDWNDRYDDDRDRGRYNREQIIRLAQQNGYRDGFRHGQEDRRRRSRSNHDRPEYRDGMGGYRSEHGDRELYRRAYREGYYRGYSDGFRGNNWGWR